MPIVPVAPTTFSIKTLMPCSRRIGSSARIATSFEPPAFQGTMKVTSRAG
jgi:hypothetical protein